MVSADNLHLDVLEYIFTFISGNDLPSVALVSSSFLAAVIPRLYNTISYRLRQSKGYEIGETMSPFAVILAHPHLAIHLRKLEIRVFPTIKAQVHPGFMRECKSVLALCKNLRKFICTPPVPMGVLLPSLQNKPRLEDLRIYANFTTTQADMLANLRNISNLSVEFASWNVVNVLPSWAGSLSSTLNSLTLYLINDLHEDVFKSILSQLPNLCGLHVIGCPKVDHVHVLRHVSYTPLLESLSLTTSESTRSLMLPPPLLRRLKNLAFDTRYTMQPSSAPAILASILAHLKPSSPPLTSFTIKLPERKVIVGDPFISQLLNNHGYTLRRLSFFDCGVSQESIAEICESCIHLERLEVAIPMKEIIPFTKKISLSSTLHTLVDVDNHTDHGIRPVLKQENAKYMMSLSGSLRKIVTNHRIWTGRVEAGHGVIVSLEKRPTNSHGSLWFMPRD